jgi:anti-sigma regulatory factor (Ser/Thr protein kinase)/putative methionine-R-sulfoxide reductase with GAF domain
VTRPPSETPDKLTALLRVTDATLAYLPLDKLLIELLNRIAEILQSDTAAFLLLDENSNELVARAAKGIEEEVEQGVRIPVGKGFAGRIAAERRAIFIPDVDHSFVMNPILREKGIHSLLGVPLLVEGRVTGVLHVGSLTPREFTDQDRDLLQLAADRAGLAIEHARLFQQVRIVEMLQESLVPQTLPDVAGLELGASYRPAMRGTGIGGDWYDVFTLPGGEIALVIGDVMGHGLPAAALMAQVRTGLRAYAIDGHPPAGVVERLNRLAASLGPSQMTTVSYVVLDMEAEQGRTVSAGHLPPLIKPPRGNARTLAVEGDPPLGVSQATRYREHEFSLPAGSTVVMVTDGAIEVRGETLDRGIERLKQLVDEETNLPALCDRITHGALRPEPAEDDVAALAARVAPLPDRLRTTWPANADTLAFMRPLLRRWLAKWGAAPDEIYDITVAVQEASANAVEHAYAPGAAVFYVDAMHEEGVITVVVHDRGHWREPRGRHRGRGFSMMRALMESVDVRQGEEGTTVVLRRRLSGAVA